MALKRLLMTALAYVSLIQSTSSQIVCSAVEEDNCCYEREGQPCLINVLGVKLEGKSQDNEVSIPMIVNLGKYRAQALSIKVCS